jgi:hypothetical protein
MAGKAYVRLPGHSRRAGARVDELRSDREVRAAVGLIAEADARAEADVGAVDQRGVVIDEGTLDQRRVDALVALATHAEIAAVGVPARVRERHRHEERVLIDERLDRPPEDA